MVVEFLEPLAQFLRNRTMEPPQDLSGRADVAAYVVDYLTKRRRMLQKDWSAHVSCFRIGLLLGVFVDAFKVGS